MRLPCSRFPYAVWSRRHKAIGNLLAISGQFRENSALSGRLIAAGKIEHLRKSTCLPTPGGRPPPDTLASMSLATTPRFPQSRSGSRESEISSCSCPFPLRFLPGPDDGSATACKRRIAVPATGRRRVRRLLQRTPAGLLRSCSLSNSCISAAA